MPRCFRVLYQDKVAVIIDYFELFTEKPSSALNQVQTYSRYFTTGNSHFHFRWMGWPDVRQVASIDAILLQININGLPLFKSSNMPFWSILGRMFHRTDPEMKLPKQPFIIGIILCRSAMPQHTPSSNKSNTTEDSGCDKCVQKVGYLNKVTFPETEADLKIDVQFVERLDDGHYVGVSPLTERFHNNYFFSTTCTLCVWVSCTYHHRKQVQI